MLETLRTFLLTNNEYGWLLELALVSAAWVALRFSMDERPKWTRAAFEFVLLWLLMAVGFLFCIALLFPKHSATLLWGLVQGFITYWYLCRFSSYQRKTAELLWLALYASSLSIMPIAGEGSILVGGFFDSGTFVGALRLFIYLSIPAVALYLRRFNFDEYSVVPRSGMRMLAFGAACVLLLYVVETAYMLGGVAVTVTLLVAYFSMLAMTLSAIQAMHTMCREQSALLELQAEKQRFLAEREMTQMTESKLEDLRCIRHDLKNQYSYMQILLSEQRYEELQQYFAKLAENLPTQLNMIDCGNRTMNTVLNMEMQKLKSDRISFEHQLVVPPVLPFPDEDVCAIVTNLLDNAADECRRLLQKGWLSVKVRLEIYPHQSYLYIKCLNSTDREDLRRSKGGLLTTKNDEQLHGYGTKIITKLAEKYNGCADFSLDDGQFVAQVMLDMTEGNRNEDQDRTV